jgi:hypothetical protein
MESGDVVADPWIERWALRMSPWIPRMPSRDEEKSRWNPETSSQIPGSSDGFSGCRRGFPGCRPKRRRSRDEIWRCRCNFPRPLLDPPPLRGRGRHRPALLPRLFRDGPLVYPTDKSRTGNPEGEALLNSLPSRVQRSSPLTSAMRRLESMTTRKVSRSLGLGPRPEPTGSPRRHQQEGALCGERPDAPRLEEP